LTKVPEEDKEKEKKVFFVDPQFVFKWLLEKKVLEHYFTIIGFHVEILRQGAELLKFMAQRNQLTKDHVDTLWELSLGNHEHDKRIIYESLCDISTKMAPELVEHLFERIFSTPLEAFDMILLDLVFKMTTNALRSESEGKSKGLEIFWLLITGEKGTKMDPKIAEKVTKILGDLLTDPNYVNQKQNFVDKCLEFLDKPQVLVLLQQLLDSFQKKKRRPIEDIDKKVKLVNTIIGNLAEFKKSAQDLLLEKKKKQNIQNIDEIYMTDNRYKYIEHLEIRLNFLEFILFSSSLELTQENVDKLWKTLIENSLSPREREISLLWLEKIQTPPSGAERACSELIGQQIFEKMTSLDCSFFSPVFFEIFSRYFLLINEKLGRIKGYERPNKVFSYGAISSEILGLEILWEIIMSSDQEDVAASAIQLLNSTFH